MAGLDLRTEGAKWRTLYDAIRTAPHDTTFSYEELTRLAGLDPEAGEDIRGDRWIVHRCRVELMRHDKRYLDVVRTVGYRIVESEEHLDHGHAYRRKSMRAAGRSKKVLAAADMSRIADPAVRSKILDLEVRMSRLGQQLARHDERIAATEEITEGLTHEVVDHSDRIAALEARIRRMAGEGS